MATPCVRPGLLSGPGGTTISEDVELLPDSPFSCLGWSVAADGDTVLAGAFHDSTLGQHAGAAYVFVRNGSTWRREAKLLASDGVGHDLFGCSVEIDGDLAFVGATDAGNGSVYVFSRTAGSWAQQEEIEASDATGGASAFGAAILCRDDLLVIGAPLHDGVLAASPDQGAVYVFARNGTSWDEQQSFVSSDIESGDVFGGALDLDADTLIVGARGDDDIAPSAGAAYVFRRSGMLWVEEAKLTPSDGESSDLFGTAVGLQGDIAVVGTELAGAVYVYRRQGATWMHEATVSYPASFGFGRELSFREDLLLVGAPEDPTHGITAGLAFVLRRSGMNWLPVATLVSTDIVEGDVLGRSVALSDARAIVGAFLDDGAGPAGGAVYVFSSGAPSSYCTGKTSSMGCVPFVTTSGVPSVSATHSFEIRAESVLRDEPGILLYGFKKANFNFHGGKLCLKAPVFRLLPPKPAKATGQPPCTGVLRRNFQNHLQSGANPALSVGQTVRAQWLLRDPADPLGFGDGLTDAVQFTVGP